VTTTPHGLARRSVGPTTLWLFGVSASAPMTVLAGGVVTTYAVTGVIAVPLSFLLLTVVLLLFAVGFAALTGDTPHAAPFVALLAAGLGRGVGLAGAAVALLSYNAIQVALYGLLGATTSGLLGGPWWAWALAAWTLIALLGVGNIGLNTRVVAAVLISELAVILAFDTVGFAAGSDNSAETLFAPLRPDLFLVDGVGGVLAFGIAAFIGFESVAGFAEETRTPHATRRALHTILVFLGALYTLSSWALALAVGPDRIADAAREQGSTLPFTILDTTLGPQIAAAGLTLLGLSIVGAMISFHHVVGRYLYALGREAVLPTGLGTTGGPGRRGVPVTASLAQTGTALAGIAAFTLAGTDPLTMFTRLATLAAIGVMTLMTAASLAVIGTRIRHPSPAGWPAAPTAADPAGDGTGPGWVVAGLWQRELAPTLAALGMLAVLAVTVSNLDSTLADPTGLTSRLLCALVVAAAAAGIGWAGWLHRHRPGAWAAIGRGQPTPLAVLDHLRLEL
jgi:amino acid transporter